VREQLQQQKDLLRRREIEEKALAQLLRSVGEFALPGDLVDKEVESAERRRTFELRFQQGKTEEEARSAIAEEAAAIRADVERGLRHFFLLDEIAEREGIKVTDADVQGRVARLAAARGQSPAHVWEELQRHEVIPQLRHDILDEKTRAVLREHAKVTETQG